LLQVYTESLIAEIPYIFEQRSSLVEEIKPVFNALYSSLSQRNESVSIEYASLGNEEFSLEELFQIALAKDLTLGRTTQGIHRDDLIFKLNDEPVKRFASQGQRKTFLVALKLAQFHLLKQRAKKTPVLLLDDVFDKLDDNRIALLITELNSAEYGQVFISDARPERSTELLGSVQFEHFRLEGGSLT
jgi:DNA replication and repair protein RecF